MRTLDDCVIKRYDDDRGVQEEVAVRVLYSPKSRTLHNLINKQQTMELPVISVSLGAIQRTPNRVFNKIDGPTILNENLTNPKQPVPVSITVNVSILTKYQNDMDQIISNMIPYFDPYVVISWTHPELMQEIRSKVEWSGSLNYSYPNDLQASQPYRQSVDTTFTIEGWLFKKAEANSGIIHKITTDFIGVADLAEIEKDYYDPTEYDRVIIDGIPIITGVKPIDIKKEDTTTVYLWGNMLDKADHVYLSGSMFSYTSADYIDSFSENSKLSADNPPFYGTELNSYETAGNAMILTLDPLITSGKIDIIVLNQAGYGSVIKNASVESPIKSGLNVF